MAAITVEFLVSKPNKDGTSRHYWQPSATLRAAGFTPKSLGRDTAAAIRQAMALNDEVALWRTGAVAVPQVKPKVQTGTLSALIARYRTERVHGIDPATGRRFIKETTAETYEVQLKRLDIWAGKHPLAFITKARVKALRNALVDAETGIGHSAAHNTLKVLRQLFAFAEREDIIPIGTNPATNFDLGAPPSRKQVWEAEDELAFINAAFALGKPSMALALKLAIYTAQRTADLIEFSEGQLEPLEIHDPFALSRLADKKGVVWGWKLGQGKSNGKTQMEIPLEPTILAEVERALNTNRARDRAAKPQRLLTYLLIDDDTNLPWHIRQDGETRQGSGARREFHKTWTAVIDKAVETTGRKGMHDLVWHDLRRTRVVRLRRRGMRPEQIASITGHSLASIKMMLEVYGPIDPTITAHAIAGTLDVPAPKAKAKPQRKGQRA